MYSGIDINKTDNYGRTVFDDIYDDNDCVREVVLEPKDEKDITISIFFDIQYNAYSDIEIKKIKKILNDYIIEIENFKNNKERALYKCSLP